MKKLSFIIFAFCLAFSGCDDDNPLNSASRWIGEYANGFVKITAGDDSGTISIDDDYTTERVWRNLPIVGDRFIWTEREDDISFQIVDLASPTGLSRVQGYRITEFSGEYQELNNTEGIKPTFVNRFYTNDDEFQRETFFRKDDFWEKDL